MCHGMGGVLLCKGVVIGEGAESGGGSEKIRIAFSKNTLYLLFTILLYKREKSLIKCVILNAKDQEKIRIGGPGSWVLGPGGFKGELPLLV